MIVPNYEYYDDGNYDDYAMYNTDYVDYDLVDEYIDRMFEIFPTRAANRDIGDYLVGKVELI